MRCNVPPRATPTARRSAIRSLQRYNRANGTGEEWPLIVDWLLAATDGSGAPVLSSADRRTIRDAFLIWANDCIHASTTYGDHPEPIGVTDSVALLPNQRPYRMAANNYYLGHARLLTMMSLAIDPSDDPPVDPSQPITALGNSLRSYIHNATGAWLYQEFAMFGDADAVTEAYGINGTDGFGLASGGLPPEGMLYGHSFGFVLGQLLALRTAGFTDPTLAGPQSALATAPVWNRYAQGYIASLTPTPIVSADEPWLGPVYEFASYGDLLRLWVTPDMMQSYALWSLLGDKTGDTSRRQTARWFAVNATEGGGDALRRASRTRGATARRPRSFIFFCSIPTRRSPPIRGPHHRRPFIDPGAGRIVAHSDWSADAPMFDYRASWISINHQLGDGGQFEFYRAGEWLTKETSNYDNNALGLTSMYHNTLALKNWSAAGTPALQWYEQGEWDNGSQWMLGANAGDPHTLTSTGTDYVHATSDLTPLYNRPGDGSAGDAATDIVQATRSIVWLRNDFIVVYDRATSQHAGLFKRFNLSFVESPAIAGGIATETLSSGQHLFVQTLLPSNPSTTIVDARALLNPIAELEPTRYVYQVEDPNHPIDTRFLNVLEGADAGAAMHVATRKTSSAGALFDGAEFASYAIYFARDSTPSVPTTLTLSPAVHTLLVAGLAVATPYSTTIVPVSGGGHEVTISAGTGATTDAAGLLEIML